MFTSYTREGTGTINNALVITHLPHLRVDGGGVIMSEGFIADNGSLRVWVWFPLLLYTQYRVTIHIALGDINNITDH